MEQSPSKKSGTFLAQKLSVACSLCRKSRACGAGEKNDEARMTNDEGVLAPRLRGNLSEEAFWSRGEATVVCEGAPAQVYDLEERTARFGEAVISFCKKVPQGPTTNRIISQLI